MNKLQKFSPIILRIALALIFLWFGFSQLTSSLNWVKMVPEWAVNLLNLPPAMIVMGNGIFEIILGSLLAMGFFVRIISFIFALHLIPITINLGLSPNAVRDFGLILSSLSLSLIYTKNSVEPKIETQV